MSGFDELHQVRQVLFWSMWLFIGIQVIFASFFLSMLGISRGTYLGDYDLKEVAYARQTIASRLLPAGTGRLLLVRRLWRRLVGN